MKNSFFLLLITFSTSSFAQNVGINATGATPDNSAILDVSSNDKGMLIPRLTEAQRISIATPATGLIVYQTNNTDGFWYFDGTQWINLSGGDNDWHEQGGSAPADNINDNIYTNGNVGIGTNAPTNNLDVNGTVRIRGGNPADDRVLTSDANGNGTWENPFDDKMVVTSNFALSEDDVAGALSNNFSGDDASATATMPFSITLGGTTYNTIYISSNGFIEFTAGTGGTDWSNDALPSANHSNPLVAGYWDDLVATSIRHGVQGTAPNRVYIINYDAYRYNNTGDIVDFQIQIHEGSGVINVKYFDVSPNTCGQTATIGYQGAGGSAATAYPLGYNARILDDNRNSVDSWSISPVR